MLLVADNGSVYTKRLVGFLTEKRIPFQTHSPQSLDTDSLADYDSFILSGRRRNDKKTNLVNSKIVTYCIRHGHKLLGICYGAEILALALGGTIRKAPTLQRGTESVQIMTENPICCGSLDVFESHGYEISKLPACLIPLAKSDNCRYEIVRYGNRPIFGTQFHPEMSRDGNDLIERFCAL